MMRMMLALVHATLTSATAAGSSGFKPNIVMHLADGGRATRASAAQYLSFSSAALTRSESRHGNVHLLSPVAAPHRTDFGWANAGWHRPEGYKEVSAVS